MSLPLTRRRRRNAIRAAAALVCAAFALYAATRLEEGTPTSLLLAVLAALGLLAIYRALRNPR